jgi:PST family polysaccharide transporter
MSYSASLRATGIIGSAQGLSYIVGLLRIKAIALLLGPSGVGLLALYTSASELMKSGSGLGLGNSGIRELADAAASDEPDKFAHSHEALRRLSWVLGCSGSLVITIFSKPISVWMFGNPERWGTISILGTTALFGVLYAQQMALIQALRQVGDMARVTIFSALATTASAVSLYAAFGEQAIAPSIAVLTFIQLGVSSFFYRKLKPEPIAQSIRSSLKIWRRLIRLGSAFAYSALLSSAAAVLIQMIIVRGVGSEGNGIFQAASVLGGLFASFIINAMAADYYPRLTSVANDNQKISAAVSQQVEVGLLLGLPGVLVLMSASPLLVLLFYSSEFAQATQLISWIAVGVFMQLVTWPIAFIPTAKGAARWIFLCQTSHNVLLVSLTMLLVSQWGVIGAAWAFFAVSILQGALAYGVARRICGLQLSAQSVRLLVSALTLVLCALLATQLLIDRVSIPLTIGAAVFASILTFRGLASRLSSDDPLLSRLWLIPGVRYISTTRLGVGRGTTGASDA